MNEKAKYYINKLHLEPHPEGGYYREIYRSGEIFFTEFLGGENKKSRSTITSIYFLLEGKQVSHFHRLKSDEIWHFYDGTPVKIHLITKDRKNEEVTLGSRIEDGEYLQFVIKKENWFAAEVIDKNSFSLVGCDVAPGFDFEDFELGKSEIMIKEFPEHKDLILKFTID